MPEIQSKEAWATRLGVILAVTGSAVGLGNFLRFPGLAAKYEGGAFMIPYFVSFFLLGLPLAWVEWAIGRYGGARGFNSAPGIYRSIWRSNISPYFGALAMLVPVGIYMFYVVIEAWCLGYAWNTATGGLALGNTDRTKYINFFEQFTGANANGANFVASTNSGIFFVFLCFILNFVLIYRGIARGIEWFCSLAMPALIVCALIVLVRVLTLGTPDPSRPELNILSGLGFMWNPRIGDKGLLESLSNGTMWLEAAGQIFFSLSVGFGIIVNYASYVRQTDDIALSGLTSSAGNEFCEVGLGGLITIPAAFVFLGASGASGSSFDLGFKTLPMVFESMFLGRFVGTLFFFLLFLAALTSSLSMLQPAIALMEEGLGMGRKASVSVLIFITAVGALFVLYFSKSLTALDTFDFWVGTVGIFILATFQIILFGWVLGIERGYEELQRGAEIRIPRFWMFIIKYISPTFLLIVFIAFVYRQITVTEGNYFKAIAQNPDVRLSVIFLLILAIFFVLLVAQAIRRWRKMELDRGFEVVQP